MTAHQKMTPRVRQSLALNYGTKKLPATHSLHCQMVKQKVPWIIPDITRAMYGP
jgi:hypothetical protein